MAKEYLVKITVSTIVTFSNNEGDPVDGDEVSATFNALGYGLGELIEHGEYSLVSTVTEEL